MIKVVFILIFVIGSSIIYRFNCNENFGIIISFIFSFGAVVWNGYKFFDDKKWKKDIENIKYTYQKNLEAYKLYINKKIDNIFFLHEAISNALGICYSYQCPNPILEYNKLTEIDFYELFNVLKLTQTMDQNSIISFWKENKDASDFNTKIHRKIYDIKYRHDFDAIDHMNYCLRMANLYLQDSDFKLIKDLVLNINKFFTSAAPMLQKDNDYNGKPINKINDDFDINIVPILKKTLKDFDHVS